MAASPSRVAWDACTWIALIQKEKIKDASGKVTEDRERLCKVVFNQAEQINGGLEILSSAFCLAEVCKEPAIAGDVHKLDDFFERESIVLVALDREIGYLARDLMGRGYTGLKPPDAIHLATALYANVAALHTFDGKLLGLDGQIDKPAGGKLVICKPSLPGGKGPLEALAERAN